MGCYKLVEVINHSSLNVAAGSFRNGYVGYYAIEVHTGESEIVNINDHLFYTHNGINYLVGYVGDASELVLPNDYCGANYKIYEYAFRGCTGLTSITIPSSATSIGDSAFYECTGLKKVYYGGTESQWSSIYIGSSYNSALTSAAHYYYSDEAPTTTRNYWHYDENGEIAIW